MAEKADLSIHELPAPPPDELRTPCRPVTSTPVVLPIDIATQEQQNEETSTLHVETAPSQEFRVPATNPTVQATPPSVPATPAPATPPSVARIPKKARSPGVSEELASMPCVSVVGRALVQCVNYYLRKTPYNWQVTDVRVDLRDGLFLGALISEWQKASLILPYPLPPVSHTHSFENVQAVLTVVMNNGFLLKTNSVREIVEGNQGFMEEFLQRLLAHYHCTFGVVECTQRDFKLDLFNWLQLVLCQSSVQLTADCWCDGHLLASLLQHCSPQLGDLVDAANTMDEVMKVAEDKFAIPVLFTSKELTSSQLDAELLLLLYLSFYIGPYSPTQHKLISWVSALLTPTSSSSPTSGTTPTLASPPISDATPTLTSSPISGITPTLTSPPISDATPTLTSSPISGATPTLTSPPINGATPTLTRPPISDSLISSVLPFDTSLGLSSSHFSDGCVLYHVLHSVTQHTLPDLCTMPNASPTYLTSLALTEAQRHLGISVDFTSQDLLTQAFPRLVFLERLYSIKDAHFQPHDSAYFFLHADVAKQHLLGSQVVIEIDYQKPDSNQRVSHDDVLHESVAASECQQELATSIQEDTPQEAEDELEIKNTSTVRECVKVVHTNQPIEGGVDWSKLEVSVQEVNGTCHELLDPQHKTDSCLRFSYAPEQVGTFVIHIQYNGKSIPDAPIKFEVFDPQQCTVVSPITTTSLVGDTVNFTADTSKAGPGMLTANLTYEALTESEVDMTHLSRPSITDQKKESPPNRKKALDCVVQNIQANIYGLSFTPQEEGTYSLKLFYNGLEIATTCIKVKCVHVHIEVKDASLHSPTFFTLKTKYPPEKLKVKVEPAGQPLTPVTLSPLSYSYTTSEVGKHRVVVMVANKKYNRNVYHTDPSLAKECVLVTTPPAGVVKLGQQGRYVLDCERAGRGKLTGTVQEPDHSKLETDVKRRDNDGLYIVSFTPTQVGEHLLYLYWNGVSITDNGEAARLLVCDPSRCRVRGFGVKQTVPGKESDFTVQGVRAGTNGSDQPLVVKAKYIQGTRRVIIQAAIENQKMSKYKCSYTVPGLLKVSSSLQAYVELSVFWHNLHIPGSPYRVRVLRQGLPTQCWLREWPESHLVIHNLITVLLDATEVDDDVYNRQNELTVGVHHEVNGSVDCPICEVEDEVNVFSLKFVPPWKGLYCMDVQYRGEVIAESGLDLDVHAPLFESFLEACYSCYKPLKFRIDMNASMADDYGYSINELEVTISQGRGHISEIHITGNSCWVNLVPIETGDLGLTLMHAEINYSNEIKTEILALPPSKLTCREVSHDGSQCVAQLDLYSPDRTLTGYKNGLEFLLNGTSSNEVSDKTMAKGVTTGTIVYPEIKHTDGAQFEVSITTMTPDHYDVYLYYYGSIIPACPFRVDMTTVTHPSKVMLYDPVLPFELDKPIELVLDTSRAGHTEITDLSLTLRTSMDKEVDVDLQTVKEAEHLFRMKFVVHNYDVYHVHLRRCGVEIEHSPVSLPLLEKKRALATIKYQPNLGSRVVVTASLTLKSDEEHSVSGESHVATVMDEDSGTYNIMLLPEMSVQQYEKGWYLIRMFGYQQNIFLLHVFCLGKELKGSPFTIDTTKPPLTRPLPTNKSILSVQLPPTKYRSYGNLSASVVGKGKGPRDIPVEISKFEIDPEKELAYIEIYNKKGKHPCDLELFWNHIPFCGSPFTLEAGTGIALESGGRSEEKKGRIGRSRREKAVSKEETARERTKASKDQTTSSSSREKMAEDTSNKGEKTTSTEISTSWEKMASINERDHIGKSVSTSSIDSKKITTL